MILITGASGNVGKEVPPLEAAFDLPEDSFSPTLRMTNPRSSNTMTIHLTPEQERRFRAVLDRGAYKSVEEVFETALAAVEQRTVPGFAGTSEELDTLLAEGLASKQLTEDEFWSSESKQTDALLAEHKTDRRS
jgi:Arc/MetJ-type ribon-helix-helix transcriptional regulator